MNLWDTTLPRRLWAKVDPTSGPLDCWRWTASLNDGGYGQIYYNGQPRRAHRLTYELLIADIPEGLTLDHLCRNRWCVNPWHLEPVPNEVNIARGEFHIIRPPLRSVCKNGHPFVEGSFRVDPEGARRCIQCERRNRLASYHRCKARTPVSP